MTADTAQLPHHRKESELSLSEMWLALTKNRKAVFRPKMT